LDLKTITCRELEWASPGLMDTPKWAKGLEKEMSLGRSSKYSAEFKHDAVVLVRTNKESLRKAAANLGMGAETLRRWVLQDRIDRGEGQPGELTTAERQELTRLRRENRQLLMEREILKKAAAFFAKETTR